MNFEQLKTEAAKLSPEERLALADWLETDRQVAKVGHERLKREIQVGLDELERGEFISGEDVFARLRARLTEKR